MDRMIPFYLENAAVRGQFVRLGPAVTTLLNQHPYPQPLARVLGQMSALSALLSGLLKHDGLVTVQLKGKHPVRLMVADATSSGHLRSYAQFETEAPVWADPSADLALPHIVGEGVLAITLEHENHPETYQGIVALEGASLTECLHHYFRQSDQFEAALKLEAQPVEEEGGPAWQAGGIFLQHLPTPDDGGDPDLLDQWRHSLALLGTVSMAEILDPNLPMEDLLYRVFHEQGIRISTPRTLEAKCRCSAEKLQNALASMGPEIEELRAQGPLEVTCEFCGKIYKL